MISRWIDMTTDERRSTLRAIMHQSVDGRLLLARRRDEDLDDTIALMMRYGLEPSHFRGGNFEWL